MEQRLGGRAARLQGIDTVSLMAKMGAMVNGVPTHGALLLLGKASSDAHLAGLAPRIAVSRYGEDGRLYQKMTVRMPFILGIERLVQTLCAGGRYPEYAVRELVTNAVAHCDYLLRNNIQIIDRHDVLTVTNHGTWAKGTPAGALRRDFEPAPMRNPALCRLMVQCSVMDALGVGLMSVQNQLKAEGLPSISFEHGQDTVTARLYASQEAQQASRIIPSLPRTVSGAHGSDTAGHNGSSHAHADAEAALDKTQDDESLTEAPQAAGAEADAIQEPKDGTTQQGSSEAYQVRGSETDSPDLYAAGAESVADSSTDEGDASPEPSGENLFFASAWGVDAAAIAKQRADEAARNVRETPEAAAQKAQETQKSSGSQEVRESQEAHETSEPQEPRESQAAEQAGTSQEPVEEKAVETEQTADAETVSGGSEPTAHADNGDGQGDSGAGDLEEETLTDIIVLRAAEDLTSDELKELIVPVVSEGNGMTRSEIVKALRATGIQTDGTSKFARRVGRLLDQLHKGGVIQKGNPDKRHWYAV